MAKSLLIAVLIATLMMVSQTLAQEEDIIEISPSPEPEDDFDYLAPDESIDDLSPEESIDEFSPEESTIALSPAEEYDDKMFHSLSPDLLKVIEDCAKTIGNKCGNEVFLHLLEDQTVSKECCKIMLKMGKNCHEGLTKAVFATYEFKANASEGVPRSKQVWNKCVVEVGAEIGSPVPFEN